MAEPLARSDAIRLLEDAVGLLRQAPSGVLITHWIGSVPFALALLLSWNRVTNSRTTDAAWAGESLALALLLLWMNCCRTVYAGKLRRHLSGVSDAPWTARRAFRLAAMQSFFGATKLLVLPFCLLILFPWAKAVAFYRTLAVVADREELTPRQAITQARRLAGFKPAQNWAVLALLLLFQVVVTLNVAIVLAVLPQLVRMLTGYESTYSRSGDLFRVTTRCFCCWCWRFRGWRSIPSCRRFTACASFEAESMETGEDLRCGLRRIRIAAPVVAALLLLLVAAPRTSGRCLAARVGKGRAPGHAGAGIRLALPAAAAFRQHAVDRQSGGPDGRGHPSCGGCGRRSLQTVSALAVGLAVSQIDRPTSRGAAWRGLGLDRRRLNRPGGLRRSAVRLAEAAHAPLAAAD